MSRKRIYYVRYEANEYVDAQVLATSKAEAEQIAWDNIGLPQGFGNSFEVGEVSTKPLSGWYSEEPTVDEPFVLERN